MSQNKPTKAEIDKSLDTYRRLWKPDHVEGMTLAQYNAQKMALVQSLKRMDEIKTNCGHCLHFCLDVCGIHKADVPVAFQKTEGECELWVYDGVPLP